MPRERLNEKQIRKILADYAQLQSYAKTAKLNGVSETTVRYHVKNRKECADLCARKKEENDLDMLSYMDSKKERVQEIIDVYLGILTDPAKLNDATLREITTALGTLIDKWTKLDSLKQSGAAAHTTDMQTLADLLQHPVPDRNIKDFEQ